MEKKIHWKKGLTASALQSDSSSSSTTPSTSPISRTSPTSPTLSSQASISRVNPCVGVSPPKSSSAGFVITNGSSLSLSWMPRHPLPQQPLQPFQNHLPHQPLQLLQSYHPPQSQQILTRPPHQQPQQHLSQQPQQHPHFPFGVISYQVLPHQDNPPSHCGPLIAISLPQPLTPAPPDPQPETVPSNLQHQPEVRLPNLPDLIIEPAVSSSRQSNSSDSGSVTASQEVKILTIHRGSS